LRTLYSVFDRGAPRTAGHIGTVLLLGSEASAGVGKYLFTLLISGFKMWWSPTKWKRETMGINDWCGMIDNNYPTLFNMVGRFTALHLEASRWMKRASIVGAMFATFDKNVKGSEEFWGTVFSGIDLKSKTDPRYQLRDYLMTHGHSSMIGPMKVSQDEMYCVCLTQWNHWREGKSVTVVKGVSERPKVKS